ncbi:MAG: peptide chain release factor N(5)-glutamine methyltransferase [Candidatus Cloacimonadota bacterium]|nr:MAG: peptide chain release factor N(5)-glutamine methyltransferase [Candidatus Cloacimonadota bacterium]
MRWTVKELIKTTSDYLRKKEIDEPRLTTEILLAHTLNMKRVSLYLNFDKPVKEEELSIFRNLIKRRLADEPVQYITGKTGFMGFEIEIKEGVFIPRQETEILVSEVKNWLNENSSKDFVLYDIGTGTGAICLSIAKFFKDAQIYASDVSEVALECAKGNSIAYNMEGRINFLSGDLFEPFKELKKADVIVSNPPYIPTEELKTLPLIVKKEPAEAIDGGKDGLYFVERIIREAKDYLKPGGLLAIEIGISESEPVKKLFEMGSKYKDLNIVPDLRGIKRVVTAERSK